MKRKQHRPVDGKPPSGPAPRQATTPVALYQIGLDHLNAGRILDAQVFCQRALAADSGHADSLHLMGRLSIHTKQYDAAEQWLARAIARDPKPEYISSLGTARLQQGRHEDALKAFDKAVQLNPADPELWVNLGTALAAMKRTKEALLACQRALELDPVHCNAAYTLGVIFYEAGNFDEALSCFHRCDKLRPNDLRILHYRAATLRGLKRFDECLADNLRVHRIDPTHPLHCNNIGDALLCLGRRQEALTWFDRALKLKPDDIEALSNKAVWYRQHHRLAEAAELYQRLRSLHPSPAKVERDLAYTQLLMGDFERGLAGREARWKVPGLPILYPNFSQPIWLGNEAIEGKNVLIYADEGLGDAIQFARYLPMLAARGARIILVVPDALYPLLSGLAGVHECRSFAASGPPPVFECYCPLGSLPLAFGTRLETIPPVAHLPPPDQALIRRWHDRLGHDRRLRVGLVWSGNPKHGNDRERSIPLANLAALFELDACFVSLQKDPRPDDRTFLSQRTDILDLTQDLTDFAETAALVSCLDVVITVDTSVAHLAATLGRPTWVLLPYLPDWRWLLGRDDSPWYPTARLLRQSEERDWQSVLDRVRTELLSLVATHA
jgi:tetratricopeptide (TPR) repeat protein